MRDCKKETCRVLLVPARCSHPLSRELEEISIGQLTKETNFTLWREIETEERVAAIQGKTIQLSCLRW